MAKPFRFSIKNAHEKALKKDGIRILVDRLWPRGVSKEDANIDIWFKDGAPSTELRKWFDHDPAKWLQFRKRYAAELKEKEATLMFMLLMLPSNNVTLVYGSKEPEMNNATVLKEYLELLT